MYMHLAGVWQLSYTVWYRYTCCWKYFETFHELNKPDYETFHINILHSNHLWMCALCVCIYNMCIYIYVCVFDTLLFECAWHRLHELTGRENVCQTKVVPTDTGKPTIICCDYRSRPHIPDPQRQSKRGNCARVHVFFWWWAPFTRTSPSLTFSFSLQASSLESGWQWLVHTGITVRMFLVAGPGFISLSKSSFNAQEELKPYMVFSDGETLPLAKFHFQIHILQRSSWNGRKCIYLFTHIILAFNRVAECITLRWSCDISMEVIRVVCGEQRRHVTVCRHVFFHQLPAMSWFTASWNPRMLASSDVSALWCDYFAWMLSSLSFLYLSLLNSKIYIMIYNTHYILIIYVMMVYFYLKQVIMMVYLLLIKFRTFGTMMMYSWAYNV